MRQWWDPTACAGRSPKPHDGAPPRAHGGHAAPRRGPQVIPSRVAEPLVAGVHKAPRDQGGSSPLAHARQTCARGPPDGRAVGQCRCPTPAQRIAGSPLPARIAGGGCPTDRRPRGGRRRAAGARAGAPGAGLDPPPTAARVHPPPPIGGRAATRTPHRVAASSGEPPAPHARGATRGAAAVARLTQCEGNLGGQLNPQRPRTPRRGSAAAT